MHPDEEKMEFTVKVEEMTGGFILTATGLGKTEKALASTLRGVPKATEKIVKKLMA